MNRNANLDQKSQEIGKKHFEKGVEEMPMLPRAKTGEVTVDGKVYGLHQSFSVPAFNEWVTRKERDPETEDVMIEVIDSEIEYRPLEVTDFPPTRMVSAEKILQALQEGEFNTGDHGRMLIEL